MEKIKKVVLREDLLAITGDFRKAIILNQFIYWSERVADADKFIEKENEIAQNNGEEERELFYGWIYKTADELSEEIMLGLSASQVRRYIKDLVDMGFISKRNNPKYKWDRTLQYRVNLVNVAKALKEKGYPLSEYKIELPDDFSNAHGCAINKSPMENQSVSDAYAIPDTTTIHYSSNTIDTENKDFISNRNKETKTSNYGELEECVPSPNKKKKSLKYRDEDLSDMLEGKLSKAFFRNYFECEYTDTHYALATHIVNYFFKEYKKFSGKQHEMITDEYAEIILSRIARVSSEMEEVGIDSTDQYDYYHAMVDEFFKSDYGKNSGTYYDKKIYLFFADGNQAVLFNRIKDKFQN